MLNSAGLLCLQGQRVCVAGLGGTAHWIRQRRADPGCCRWPVGLPEVARLLATQAPPLAVTCQTRARSSAGTRSTSELGGRFTPPHPQRASSSVSGDGARFRTSLAAPGGRSVPVCGVDRPAESDRRAAHFASFPAAGSQAARHAPQVAAPRAVRSVAKPHCDSRVLSLCPLDSMRKSLTFTTSCPLVPKKRP